MKLFRPVNSLLLLLCLSIALCSATMVKPAPAKPAPATRAEMAARAMGQAGKDGKITYKELKSVATTLKGEKLTFKERLGVRLFGKKIIKKMEAAAPATPYSGGKSQVVALILCALVGGLGIHRFYLGYTWQGVVQLLTAGGCGIWALIDLIRIITGSLQPKNGEYETTL